jgi:serine/threonine protein kinase
MGIFQLAFFLQHFFRMSCDPPWIGLHGEFPMDFLYITKYGNTAEAYLISIAILVTSLFVWRWTYAILRRTFCEWVFNIQNVFDKESLYKLTNLITLLIPIAAFHFAKGRLFFEKELSTWLNSAALVLGQIVFLLILANTLEPLAEVILIRSVRDVRRRDQKYLQTQKRSTDKIKKHIRVLMRVLLLFIPGLTIASTVTSVPIGIWVAPLGILLFELAICLRIVLTTKRSFKSGQNVDDKTVSETPLSPEVSRPLHDPDLDLKETIVRFFLDIYKHRVRALKDSPAEIQLVDSLSFAPNYIYELRVMKDGDWQSRRMTIGPIGENTGSRSKCFYVIYDYHLVIKIPPIPINDLTKYMDMLKKERRIAKRLSMKECIIPSAAVILKLIRRFDQKRELLSEDNEEDYLKFLSISSELQKYLRVGNTFAFFMDLSKYYFLSHIIQAFHHTEKKVCDEIRKNSEVLGDYRKFEGRYGSENIPFFLEIEKLYKEYELELNKLIKQCNLPASPSGDQAKTWFSIHLVGERVKHGDEGLSAEFIVGINRLLDGIIGENLKAIQAYRDNVRKSIEQTAFVQNKSYMEGIITNLLELLAHLHEKKVAMRDLKPDNILVAGNKDKYPSFLAYPKEYKIGLIDVETAVILEKSGKKTVDQPSLGGTPQYATPCQFFDNNLLTRLYDDLTTIFHLQDWYAIIAVIYRAITGLPLFERTARMVPGIIKAMTAHKGREKEHFHSVNQAFWNSAVGEFKEKMAQKEKTFKSVHVQIFDRAKKMFREIASVERQRLAEEIDQRLNTQSIPMSAKDRHLLISCSYQKTKDLRKKWESGPDAQKKQIDRSRVILLLRDLEGLKLQLELQTQMLQLLDQSAPNISAHGVLEFMFRLVLNGMHGVQRGYLTSQDSLESADPAYGTGEGSSRSTIVMTTEP